MPEKTYHGYNWECKLLTRPILTARFLTDGWIFIYFGGGGKDQIYSIQQKHIMSPQCLHLKQHSSDRWRNKGKPETQNRESFRARLMYFIIWHRKGINSISNQKKKKIESFIWMLNADSGTSKYWCMKDIQQK